VSNQLWHFGKGLQQVFQPIARGENQNNLLNSCVICILYICSLKVWPQAALEPRRPRVEHPWANTLLFSEMKCL